MNRYFLTTCMVALLSTQGFATQQRTKELVDLETGQQALIRKLTGSSDYTLDLQESQMAKGIADKIVAQHISGGGGGKMPKSAALQSEALTIIKGNLERAKTSNASFNGGTCKLTQNLKQKALSVADTVSPLVYPVLKADRELGDAFLPLTYGDSYTGAYAVNTALWHEIKDYAGKQHLSSADTARLYHYLEPLFYVVQEEVARLVTGLSKTNWRYGSHEVMNAKLNRQSDHHHGRIQNANVTGLHKNHMSWLTQRLKEKTFALLPDPLKDLGVYLGKAYKLGVNHQGKLSLLHPFAELAYPIFKEDRSVEGFALPQSYRWSASYDKHRKWVGSFLGADASLSPQEYSRLKIILDPVAHQVRPLLDTLSLTNVSSLTSQDYFDFLSLPEQAKQNGTFLKTLSPYIKDFKELEKSLQYLKDWQTSSHIILTDDLWPTRLNKAQRDALAHKLIHELFYQELKDKLQGQVTTAILQKEQNFARDLQTEQNRARQAVQRETQALARQEGAEQTLGQIRQNQSTLQTQLNGARLALQEKQTRARQALDRAGQTQRETQTQLNSARLALEAERNRVTQSAQREAQIASQKQASDRTVEELRQAKAAIEGQLSREQAHLQEEITNHGQALKNAEEQVLRAEQAVLSAQAESNETLKTAKARVAEAEEQVQRLEVHLDQVTRERDASLRLVQEMRQEVKKYQEDIRQVMGEDQEARARQNEAAEHQRQQHVKEVDDLQNYMRQQLALQQQEFMSQSKASFSMFRKISAEYEQEIIKQAQRPETLDQEIQMTPVRRHSQAVQADPFSIGSLSVSGLRSRSIDSLPQNRSVQVNPLSLESISFSGRTLNVNRSAQAPSTRYQVPLSLSGENERSVMLSSETNARLKPFTMADASLQESVLFSEEVLQGHNGKEISLSKSASASS